MVNPLSTTKPGYASHLPITPFTLEMIMITKDFITAGNATFTLEIPKKFQKDQCTPAHYTYKVKHVEDKNGVYPPAYFIHLMNGKDNETSFVYLGVLTATTGDVRLTKASKYTTKTWPVRLLKAITHRLWNDTPEKIMDAGFDVHHEGRCGVCNRKLTTPESVKSGIGPICAKRV